MGLKLVPDYYHIMGYFHEVQIFTNATLLTLLEIFHDSEIHDPEAHVTKDLRVFCTHN